jgi:hypothetical protein
LATRYQSSAKAHVYRIGLILTVLLLTGVLAREVFLPAEFGADGYYRPGAAVEEAARQVRNLASESCFECHPLIRKLHVASTHKTISCEVCHGAFATHVSDSLVVGIMPTARGPEIRPLCLRCHQRLTRALHPETIKFVALPEHLDQKKVRSEHICNQCHHVHAPMKWVWEAREMMGLPKDKEET